MVWAHFTLVEIGDYHPTSLCKQRELHHLSPFHVQALHLITQKSTDTTAKSKDTAVAIVRVGNGMERSCAPLCPCFHAHLARSTGPMSSLSKQGTDEGKKFLQQPRTLASEPQASKGWMTHLSLDDSSLKFKSESKYSFFSDGLGVERVLPRPSRRKVFGAKPKPSMCGVPS